MKEASGLAEASAVQQLAAPRGRLAFSRAAFGFSLVSFYPLWQRGLVPLPFCFNA